MATYKPDPDATDGQRLASVETIVCDMHKRLFGNGQPGEIEEMKKRIGKMEAWLWRVAGGAAVLGFIFQHFWGKGQ